MENSRYFNCFKLESRVLLCHREETYSQPPFVNELNPLLLRMGSIYYRYVVVNKTKEKKVRIQLTCCLAVTESQYILEIS